MDRLTGSPSGRTDTLSIGEIQKLSDSSLARYILKQLQFYIDEEAPPEHVQRDQDFLAAMFAEVRRQSLESVRSEGRCDVLEEAAKVCEEAYDVDLDRGADEQFERCARHIRALQSTARVAEDIDLMSELKKRLTGTPSPESPAKEQPVEWRDCEFCGCHTNARLRQCCDKGNAADRRLPPPPERP